MGCVKLFPKCLVYICNINLTECSELLLKIALLNIVVELKQAAAPPDFIFNIEYSIHFYMVLCNMCFKILLQKEKMIKHMFLYDKLIKDDDTNFSRLSYYNVHLHYLYRYRNLDSFHWNLHSYYWKMHYL